MILPIQLNVCRQLEDVENVNDEALRVTRENEKKSKLSACSVLVFLLSEHQRQGAERENPEVISPAVCPPLSAVSAIAYRELARSGWRVTSRRFAAIPRIWNVPARFSAFHNRTVSPWPIGSRRDDDKIWCPYLASRSAHRTQLVHCQLSVSITAAVQVQDVQV